MFADTVETPRLTRNPRFMLALLALFALAAWFLDPLGAALARVTGREAAGPGARAAQAVIAAALLALNFYAVASLPRRAQILAMWAELTALLFGLFWVFDLSLPFILSKIGFLVTRGVVTTLWVSALSITFASILAVIGAIAKLSSSGIAYGIASYYTSVFRGMPLLMQVYLIYVGLPQLGFVVNAIPAGIAALSLCYGAYMTEIVRAGIQSIPRGQWEASRALGFKPRTILRRIVLPQAVPLVIPPIGNQFIAMLKDSSLVSIIGVWELMYLARNLGIQTFQHLEMLVTAAILYWAMTIVLEVLQARLERRFGKGVRT